MQETQEEYDKRQIKRLAREIKKSEGIKYTEALRQARILYEADE